MGGRYVLALDAGGGGGGALLLNLETGAATVAHRRWQHPSADPDDRWAFAFDWQQAWRIFGEVTREVVGSAGIPPEEIAAIATTGMRHGTVIIGTDGAETWAAPNRDARAAGQATELASSRGEEIYARTGLWPAPMLPLVRLRWLSESAPEILEQARHILSISDWLTYRLTGEAVAEATQASATGLFSPANGRWDSRLAATAGIDPAWLPPLAAAGSQCGRLTAAAAGHLGLRGGTPVAIGAADSQAALLGAGLTAPGDAAVIAGTTMPVLAITAEAVIDSARRLWTGRHAVEARWTLESNAGASGDALELLAAMFYPGDGMGVARLAAEAWRGAPGGGGILSDIGTTVFNASSLGLPVGTLALSTLMAANAAHPRANILRAILEGIAFGARANLEQVEEAAGRGAGPLHLAGGLSRSDSWCRILADVTGRSVVRTRVPEGSLLGAAACAATARFGSLTEATTAIGTPGTTFEPSGPHRDLYDGLYQDWTRYRAARASSDDSLAEAILRLGADGTDGTGGPERRLGGAGLAPATRPVVLVTAPIDDGSLVRLREAAEVRYEPFMESQRVLTEEDLVEACADVDLLVTEVDVVDAASLAKLPRLRAVFTCRADPVNVDIDACTAHGVPVMNAPGRNARSVAELTLAFVLALTRKSAAAAAFMRDPATTGGDIARMGMAHAEFEGRELGDLTIGLVGFGQVGREVVSVLRPLGPRIIAADPFADRIDALAEGVEIVAFAELLRRSDAVSLHAPVNDATRGMFGRAEFASMKPGALFVNTARAALVDEDALYEALASGRLGGAGLDVFATEPPGFDYPLLRFPNVVATPHIGGNTVDVARRQGAMVCDAVESLLRGEAPATLLNAAVMSGFGWDGPRRAPTRSELDALAGGRGPAVTDLELEAAPDGARGEAPRTDGSRFGKLFRGLRRGDADAAAVPAPAPAQGRPGVGSAPPAVAVPAGSGNGTAYWEALFAEFVSRLPRDTAVRKFSSSKNVMVRYHVQDLDVIFHTGFVGDPPVTGLGEPPGQPHLTLRMTSAVLDDVFMERISGMKAAMSGKMAFSGNTMRAMALQRVQKDLNRVYRSVREEMGEPPAPSAGLSAGADRPSAPGSGVESASPAGPRPAREPVAGGSRPTALGDERDEMMLIVNELFASHLLTSTGGNVSVRRPGNTGEAWITPSALPKGHLHSGMLVRIDLDGEPLDEGSLAPSSERLLHTAIYRARPEVEAVVHSHGPRAFALGLSGLPFLPVSTESAFIGDLPRVPFIMPGTEELAAATASAMRACGAALLVNHGLVVAAGSLRRAADMTAVIEQTAGALMECKAAGIPPPVLPPEIVAQLREIGEMMA